MTYRRSIIWTRVSIGIVLTIGALSTASAQAPASGRRWVAAGAPAAVLADVAVVAAAAAAAAARRSTPLHPVRRT